MRTVAVIDYGMGNLRSVAKALEHVGKRAGIPLQVSVTTSPDVLRAADRLLFPGVGAMRDCMAEIRRLCVDEMLREQVKLKPVLAICVGMQALMQHSEENGGVPCIGLFAGKVKRFDDHAVDASGAVLKVPHMGWNRVRQSKPHAMWRDIDNNGHFYFVHIIRSTNSKLAFRQFNFVYDFVFALFTAYFNEYLTRCRHHFNRFLHKFLYALSACDV